MAALMAQKAQVLAKGSLASRRSAVVVRAQKEPVEMNRRSALGMMAGVAAMVAGVSPSRAAYGDAANVFGRATNTSGFVPYAGDNFALLLPSKWNPSKEQDFAAYGDLQLRYEDNFDAVNNLSVITVPSDKSSIEQYGTPEKFLESVSFLFGKQAFAGDTISEGGFAPGRVSAASLLDVQTSTDKKGKKYYKFEVLTRTADTDEGGRHQLISASVSGGKLWILKVQIGDKRWFKGAKKDAMGALDSFTVA